MKTYEYCVDCRHTHLTGAHLPVFEVWDMDTPNDIMRVNASDAEEAAERWAEDFDLSTAEYLIVSGRYTPTLGVRESGSEEVVMFKVEGESVPEYHARAQK